MGFKVPKDVPEWMKPSRHTSEAIELAAKLQRQIDEATGGATGRMMLDLQIEQQRQQRLIEKAFGGAIDGALLHYSNTILDHLQRSRRAQYAIDMVGLFSDPQTDDDELQDWIDDNRDSLSVEDLKAIIQAAMLEGINEALSENGRKKRWTPEQLQELRDYRANHTAAETAEWFDISERLVHRLLNPANKQIKPRSVFDI
jgi:hypothetical protein